MSSSNKADKLFNVNGLVAVITGGGTGLGLHAARALDANGAKAVYIIGRREEPLREAAKTGESLIPIVGDVTSKEALEKITEQIRREQGYVNFLFANAGILGPKDRSSIDGTEKGDVKALQAALWEPEMAEFTKTLEVNVTGAYYTVIAFMDLLDAGNKKCNVAQDSSVLITSSLAGYSRHTAAGSAYSASEAAATHLVKTLSTLFAQRELGIRVNGVNPGFYPSEMNSESSSKLQKFQSRLGAENDTFADAVVMPYDHTPAKRSGSEQDLAGLILFFASQAGAFLNGETMISDGGRLSLLPGSY